MNRDGEPVREIASLTTYLQRLVLHGFIVLRVNARHVNARRFIVGPGSTRHRRRQVLKVNHGRRTTHPDGRQAGASEEDGGAE